MKVVSKFSMINCASMDHIDPFGLTGVPLFRFRFVKLFMEICGRIRI